MQDIKYSQDIIYNHFLKISKQNIPNVLISDLKCLENYLARLFHMIENNDINLFIKSKSNKSSNIEYIIFRLKLKKSVYCIQ